LTAVPISTFRVYHPIVDPCEPLNGPRASARHAREPHSPAKSFPRARWAIPPSPSPSLLPKATGIGASLFNQSCDGCSLSAPLPWELNGRAQHDHDG
jgi:hypothetical protein